MFSSDGGSNGRRQPAALRSIAGARRRYSAARAAPSDAARVERNAILAELPPESDDPVARLARAAIFEKHKLNPDAVQEYRKLAQLWPDAASIQSRLFDLENERPPDEKAEGKTHALLIGVSKYRSDQVPPLQYAHQDALVFENF